MKLAIMISGAALMMACGGSGGSEAVGRGTNAQASAGSPGEAAVTGTVRGRALAAVSAVYLPLPYNGAGTGPDQTLVVLSDRIGWCEDGGYGAGALLVMVVTASADGPVLPGSYTMLPPPVPVGQVPGTYALVDRPAPGSAFGGMAVTLENHAPAYAAEDAVFRSGTVTLDGFDEQGLSGRFEVKVGAQADALSGSFHAARCPEGSRIVRDIASPRR